MPVTNSRVNTGGLTAQPPNKSGRRSGRPQGRERRPSVHSNTAAGRCDHQHERGEQRRGGELRKQNAGRREPHCDAGGSERAPDDALRSAPGRKRYKRSVITAAKNHARQA